MKRKRTNWDLVKWTAWERGTLPAGPGNDNPLAVFVNSRYQVNVYRVDGGPVFGDVAWLSIKTRDKQPRHDWRDMQRIKNEIIGPEYDAVEIYPSEDKLVDAANQYHLWVFVNGFRLPFGFNERFVAEGSYRGSVQRPWQNDDRPSDLLTAEAANRLIVGHLARKGYK
jgi:hypothetical protein